MRVFHGDLHQLCRHEDSYQLGAGHFLDLSDRYNRACICAHVNDCRLSPGVQKSLRIRTTCEECVRKESYATVCRLGGQHTDNLVAAIPFTFGPLPLSPLHNQQERACTSSRYPNAPLILRADYQRPSHPPNGRVPRLTARHDAEGGAHMSCRTERLQREKQKKEWLSMNKAHVFTGSPEKKKDPMREISLKLLLRCSIRGLAPVYPCANATGQMFCGIISSFFPICIQTDY